MSDDLFPMFRWYFVVVALYVVVVVAGVAGVTVVQWAALGGIVLCLVPFAVCVVRVWRRL